MPIRTRRGRAAAYRSVWEWPLHSPVRLFACVAALAVVAILVSTAAARLSGEGGEAPAAAPESAPAAAAPGPQSARAPVPDPAAPELVPETLPTSAAPQDALDVAVAWTRAWASAPPGMTGAQWSQGLAPFTTEEYLAVLASVDPANVPDTQLSGPPQAVEVRPQSVRVQVPTQAVRLELLLVQIAPGQWRVSGYDGAS